jgi:hypothetical protein
MMVKIKEIDAQRFANAVKALKEKTGKTMPEVVRLCAVTFARSAARVTPQSKKYAEVIQNPNYSGQRGRRNKSGQLPYFAIRYNSQGQKRLVPTKTKRSEETLIKHRGAAKNVWIGCAWRMRRGLKPTGAAGKIGVAYSEIKENYAQTVPSVAVTSLLKYMPVLDRKFGIMAKSIGKASRALVRELNNLGKSWTRRWAT